LRRGAEGPVWAAAQRLRRAVAGKVQVHRRVRRAACPRGRFWGRRLCHCAPVTLRCGVCLTGGPQRGGYGALPRVESKCRDVHAVLPAGVSSARRPVSWVMEATGRVPGAPRQSAEAGRGWRPI